MGILGTIGLGIVVFASTNIDDIFILMMFFADRRYKASQVILGQYVGIGLLIAVSLLGALAALIVPPTIIGLMGVFPIAIGVKQLLDLRKHRDADDEATPQTEPGENRLQFLAIAAVTFSNGGDNIGVYVPLFANSPLTTSALLVLVFLLLVAVWCAMAFYLVRHSMMKVQIQRVGSFLLPFVLIGLGVYILVDALLLRSVS
jgi:cadmium resistance protein CadD (predicted permease)